MFAVRGAIGFVGYEVDFSEELLFVVFEFSDHFEEGAMDKAERGALEDAQVAVSV